MLAGRTVEEAGTGIPADGLGDDPLGAWHHATETALDAIGSDLERTVHLTGRDVPASAYLDELAADHLVHAWDVLAALELEEALPGPLVVQVGDWFGDRESHYREHGVIGPRPATRPGADAQELLLAGFGRASRRDPVDLAVDRFNEAFGRRDVDAIMATMTDDCVFEDTSAPVGVRHIGPQEVRAAWTSFFDSTVDPAFTERSRGRCDDRVVIEWTFTWAGENPGRVHGVDLFTVRDHKVAAKIAYVKG